MTSNNLVLLGFIFSSAIFVTSNVGRCGRSLKGYQGNINYNVRTDLHNYTSETTIPNHKCSWHFVPPNDQQDFYLVLEFNEIDFLQFNDSIIIREGNKMNHFYAYATLPAYQVVAILREEIFRSRDLVKDHLPITSVAAGTSIAMDVSVGPTVILECKANNNTAPPCQQSYYYSLRLNFKYWYIPFEWNILDDQNFYLDPAITQKNKQSNLSTVYLVIIILGTLLFISGSVNIAVAITIRNLKLSKSSSKQRSIHGGGKNADVLFKSDEVKRLNEVKSVTDEDNSATKYYDPVILQRSDDNYETIEIPTSSYVNMTSPSYVNMTSYSHVNLS